MRRPVCSHRGTWERVGAAVEMPQRDHSPRVERLIFRIRTQSMRKFYLLFLLAIFSAFSAGAWAQAPTAGVSGKVTDQTGAVIPNATVTVTGPGGKQASATSDQVGTYQIQSLAPGSYTVNATAKGFANFTQ